METSISNHTSSAPRRLTWHEKKAFCAQWKKSGLSKRAFCRRHNLTPSAFYSWYEKFFPKEKRLSKSESTKDSFVPVEQSSIASAPLVAVIALEVHLKAGNTIRLSLPKPEVISLIKELSHAT